MRDSLGGDQVSVPGVLCFCICGALIACLSGKPNSFAKRPSVVASSANPVLPLSTDPGLRILHIEAHLIFADGQLSPDIIGPHPWVLWNTVIGEGDATDSTGVHHPSTATLVRVVITGPSERSFAQARVELRVAGLDAMDTSAVGVMEAPLAAFDSSGKQSVPFRLNDTGCVTIRLTARLVTGQVLDSLRAEIPFECGE